METTLTIEESARLIELGVDAKLASHKESNWYNGISSEEFKVDHFFTLTDILSILPKMIESFHLNIDAIKEGYNVGYILWDEDTDSVKDSLNSYFAPELIDSLYQLLIWVITNNYVKTEKK